MAERGESALAIFMSFMAIHRTARNRCHGQNEQPPKNIEAADGAILPPTVQAMAPSPPSPSTGARTICAYSHPSAEPESRQATFLLSESQYDTYGTCEKSFFGTQKPHWVGTCPSDTESMTCAYS